MGLVKDVGQPGSMRRWPGLVDVLAKLVYRIAMGSRAIHAAQGSSNCPGSEISACWQSLAQPEKLLWPVVRLVTVYCPLTTTGAGELEVQTGNARFAVDCKVKPV